MTDAVREGYDTRAKEYATLNFRELDRVAFDRERLEAFAKLASPGTGVVADVGCGPGHIVQHLGERGVEAIGYDFSPGMIREAREAFPDARFEVGDLLDLDVADSSLGGLVARYSLIHLAPVRLSEAFCEWHRVLQPGAPVLVAFFAADSAGTHGQPFDHAVVTAHALFPETVVAEMTAAGFDLLEVATRSPLEGERPLDHATILARRGITRPEA